MIAAPRHTGLFLPIQAAIVVLMSVLQGCDGAGSRRTCNVLDVENHTKTADFPQNEQHAMARFFLEQAITTYETGDCDMPSSNTDGVRLVIRNLTTCDLHINFSLSVFTGSVGWTFVRSVDVASGRATDLGIIVTQNPPVVDQTQVLITGKATRTNCS